ncbi:MAG: DUF2726 domain-containing protein [Gammaproteobacteria bacterium]|nr:DUF2726 domain-containing protein [Gammaproteobacteria bacterium]
MDVTALSSAFGNLIYLAVIPLGLFALLILIKATTKQSKTSLPDEYSKVASLLTPAERSYFGCLQQSVGSDFLVFAKVRIADVLEPSKRLNSKQRHSAFLRISQKHFDFLLCDPKTLEPQLAIELDDRSHQKPKAQRRDQFVSQATTSANLKLLRVTAAKGYAIDQLRKDIYDALGIAPKLPAENTAKDTAENELMQALATVTFSASKRRKPTSPPCPKCEGPMNFQNKTLSSGQDKPQWVCNNTPNCPGVITF